MDAQPRIDAWTILRMAVGIIWIAGAIYNALWTLRHTEFLGDEGIAREATFGVYRRFFSDVVASAPVFWTLLLILGELGLGVLTLKRGMSARVGLWGSVLWSLWLFPLMWPYTLMMGPYALLPAWLLRAEQRFSVGDLIARVAQRTRQPRPRHA